MEPEQPNREPTPLRPRRRKGESEEERRALQIDAWNRVWDILLGPPRYPLGELDAAIGGRSKDELATPPTEPDRTH